MKHDQEGVLAGLAASQIDRLRTYTALLQEFGPRTGLIGPSDGADLWDRHVLDSLRARPCLVGHRSPITDLGSGAGLPGIPLAVAFPRLSFVLVEPQGRRVAFLEHAVERLALRNVTVDRARAEAIEVRSDVCLARAFAPPRQAWLIASRLLNRGGVLLYYAGRSWSFSTQKQLTEAGAVSRICAAAQFPWQGPIVAIRARDDDDGPHQE